MSKISPFTFCKLKKTLEEESVEDENGKVIVHDTEDDEVLNKTEEETIKKLKVVNIQGEEFQLSEKVLGELPYFDSLLSGRYETDKTNSGAVRCDSVDPKLFKVILTYIEDGKKLYILLGHLPKDNSAFELLNLFDFLCLESPIEKDIDKLKEMLLAPICSIMTNQEDIIKYAFALFYCYRKIDWEKHNLRKYRNAIYEKINYVFQNKGEWIQPRAKYHLYKLALHCVTFSINQFSRILITSCSIPDKTLISNDEESVESSLSSYYFSDSDNEYFDNIIKKCYFNCNLLSLSDSEDMFDI